MPIWLRDLWPAHEFDPRAIWDSDKAKAEADAASGLAEAGKGKADKKGAKAKPQSKKELIQAENAKKLYEELEQKDLEKLRNASGKSQRQMLHSMKMSTPFGRLSQLLEILTDAVEARDKKTAFDVFWAIESMPQFGTAMEEERVAKAAEDGDKKDKKKDKKDKDKEKDGKKSKSSSGASVKRSKEAQLVGNYKKVIKKVLKLREEEDMVVFQLTEMADRLPPLSRFSTGWKLDDWQKRVLAVVDRHQSAIVCAPTSSGKTVISSYVASDSAASRVLFVVPTEPLVWQVAALFHKLLKGSVGLCMDQMHFRPDINLRVIVGTPQPLETALSKLRGPAGDEALNKVDYAQMQGGFAFDYAIFDEVHSLDGDEGAALQRLIQGLSCNFLALSATIGNAQELKEWWEGIRGQQLEDVEMIEAAQEGPSDEPKQLTDASIFLEEHSGRFINLQRMVWMGDAGQFKPLHPLAAVTLDMLKVEGGCFHTFSLPFTPQDTYALWRGMMAAFPADKINDLQPVDFFAKYADSKRITLQMSKDYEDALCSRLEVMAQEMPTETQSLLTSFHPGPVGSAVDVATAARDIKAKDLCPAIMFHLDSFHCLSLFKELLSDLELGQSRKYPNYLKELQEKAEELNRLRAQAAKRRVANAKEQEEEAKDSADMDPTAEFVDTAAPHPEFVLAPPTMRLSSKEYEDICGELAPSMGKGELKHPGHPFLRALRRGFGIYIDDASFPKYRRIVQKLAQQGKLAFVFSDESLAYGVNMPFRTCCFCESMEGILTPLLAQQMSGRAGRRGLDTQGNLLFMNMSWPRIQYLMLGTIPAIQGQDPQYPTVALQHALSKIAPAEPFAPAGTARGALYSSYVNEPMARRIAGRTLKQFIDGEVPERPYLEVSRDVMQRLGYLDEYGDLAQGVSRTMCVAMWELRQFLPESIAIASVADLFLQFFAEGRPQDYAEIQAVQIEFCGLLLALIDRVPMEPGGTPLQEHPFFMKAPDRNARMEEFLKRLEEQQQLLVGLPEEGKMKLPVPLDQPLDSRVFAIVLASGYAPLGQIDSFTRFQLTKRLRKLGGVLMVLHNVLMLEDPYDVLETLLRKSFARIKYIIAEVVMEESKLDDASELEQKEAADGAEQANGGAAEAKASS
ncbi:P-loop containing nucleoside triphosphate hydrolase protein [Tribonema minus]|uniref:P-loop containing nucleoside triphosphate hydrolase protein n=1 Tax=Tribonema minus TaxID=303371 RepID=A0A836CAV0_9STRA|nr:P-loop containing nucleoside triphosphate hydrolase protein [Tribonema minus]